MHSGNRQQHNEIKLGVFLFNICIVYTKNINNALSKFIWQSQLALLLQLMKMHFGHFLYQFVSNISISLFQFF